MNKLFRLVPELNTAHKILWKSTYQLAMAGSMVPYPNTLKIVEYSMITKVFLKLECLKTDVDAFTGNSFDDIKEKTNVKMKVMNNDALKEKLEKGIDFFEKWYVPYLPGNYKEAFSKALSIIKEIRDTSIFYKFQEDEVTLLLLVMIHFAFEEIEKLRELINKKANFSYSPQFYSLSRINDKKKNASDKHTLDYWAEGDING